MQLGVLRLNDNDDGADHTTRRCPTFLRLFTAQILAMIKTNKWPMGLQTPIFNIYPGVILHLLLPKSLFRLLARKQHSLSPPGFASFIGLPISF